MSYLSKRVDFLFNDKLFFGSKSAEFMDNAIKEIGNGIKYDKKCKMLLKAISKVYLQELIEASI